MCHTHIKLRSIAIATDGYEIQAINFDRCTTALVVSKHAYLGTTYGLAALRDACYHRHVVGISMAVNRREGRLHLVTIGSIATVHLAIICHLAARHAGRSGSRITKLAAVISCAEVYVALSGFHNLERTYPLIVLIHGKSVLTLHNITRNGCRRCQGIERRCGVSGRVAEPCPALVQCNRRGGSIHLLALHAEVSGLLHIEHVHFLHTKLVKTTRPDQTVGSGHCKLRLVLEHAGCCSHRGKSAGHGGINWRHAERQPLPALMQTELLLYGVGSIKHIRLRYAAVHSIGAEGHLVSGCNHRVYLARGGMPCLEAHR